MSLDDELSQPGAQQLLGSALLARLAYLGRDGLPRVIPIGFWWDGEQVVVCTAPSAPKVAALRSRPEVALSIDSEEPPQKALLVRGAARMEIVDGVPEEYLAGAAKAMGGQEMEAFESHVRGVYKQMARIAITPQWAQFNDFGTGRVPKFLRELMAPEGA